jgi:hypothetical protein
MGSKSQVVILEKPEVKQRLTFEEICPIWAAKFHGHNLRPQHITGIGTLSLIDARTCVVGEAHNFKNWFYYTFDNGSTIKYEPCGQCEDFSGLFYYYGSHKQGEYSRKDFASVIPLFVDHWNECHVSH